jgi:predicted DNA-binding WGR domain protein
MKKHLKFVDGNSDKFWQIQVDHLSYTVTYGKNGTDGTSQIKTFENAEACLAAAEKILNEKIKKGYSENGEVIASTNTTQKSSKAESDKQAIIAAYNQILSSKNSQALLPFLESHARGNVELLKKHIKAQKRHYMTYIDLSKEPGFRQNHWGTRGDEKQKTIITMSMMAIGSKSDLLTWDEIIEQLKQAHSPETLALLHWAKPNWISELLLERLRKNEWQLVPYQTLRFLEAEGLMTYQGELYARSIAQFNEWSTKISHQQYIDYLVNDELAYHRDVPTLFDYETNLHNVYFQIDKDAPYNQYYTWEIIFEKLLAQDKLSRSYVIAQAMLMQTKDWNNNLKAFFRKRLAALAPSTDELLANQEQLFSCLQYPHSHVVNWATDLVKKIYELPDFNVISFLDWVAPVMMSNDHKGSVKTLIALLEKLAKQHPHLKAPILLLLADTFVIPDLSLQEKAAKVLLKIGDVENLELSERLSTYVPLMLGQTKTTLAAYLSDETIVANPEAGIIYQYQIPNAQPLAEPIALPQDWNEIFLLFGKFINSNEVIDSELLLNALITQHHLFPNDYKQQLQPYLQQLDKRYFDSIQKAYLSVFVQQKINAYHETFKVEQSTYHKIKTLLSFRSLLNTAQGLISSKKNLPLLCFPTHYPHWVAPKVLLERLISYVNQGVRIDRLDLSIAISRMPRAQVEEAIPLLNQLSGELKALMAFCLGTSNEISLKPQNLFKKLLGKVSGADSDHIDAVWATAARTYYPNATFEVFAQTSLAGVPFAAAPYAPQVSVREKWNEYQNYFTKKLERSESWQELHFEIESFTMPPPYFLYAQDIMGKKNTWNYFLESESNVTYWHSLMPQNNDALALYLLRSSCITASGANNELKGFLKVINTPGFTFSELSMLVFACACFQEKKETRLMVSEVLINLVTEQAINMAEFAKKLAFLAYHKYGPFARMVESTETLKEFPGLHQSAGLQLIEEFLANFKVGDKLPTNFKKLVENYVDLLFKTQQQSSAQAKAFFTHWKDNGTLKNLIKQILAS